MTTTPTIAHEGEHVVIRIPMELRRRGGRCEIIVPEGLPGSRRTRAKPQEPIVTALARAYRWQKMLESGEYASLSELAERLGVDRSYLRRILQLASLAPDIVEAIVDGSEPSGVSLEQLTKGLPLRWAEQRIRSTVD